MILKSMILGIIIFIFDLFIFGYFIIIRESKGLKGAELQKFKNRLALVIPIVLFIQLFLAIVLMYTYNFLCIYKVFSRDIIGGMSFALIFFIPMIYLLVGNLQWGTNNANKELLPSMLSLLMKLIVVGVYVGLV